MRRGVRSWDILKERDVSMVLDRFREECDSSLLHSKLTLDTTSSTAEETLRRFQKQMSPFLSQTDRRRMTDQSQ
jgi:hypothetical protein